MGIVLLVGARGSGKSAAGSRAAELLGPGWQFVEMDAVLVARLGMPVSAFFAAHGEAAFRRAEAELLADMGRGDRKIVSCGGGVAGTPESVAAAQRAGTLIWLDTPVPDLIARRLADPEEPARPALLPDLARLKAEDLHAYLRVEVPTILERRRPYYAGADFVIATEGLGVEDVAHIVAAVAQRSQP